jgi:hypothetical protein
MRSMVLVLWLHRCRHVRLPSEVSEPPSSICGLGSKVESRPRRECKSRPAHAFHHHQQHQHQIAIARLIATRYGLLAVLEACASWPKFCASVGFGLDDVWIWSSSS